MIENCAPQLIAPFWFLSDPRQEITRSRSWSQSNTHGASLPTPISRARAHPPPIDVGFGPSTLAPLPSAGPVPGTQPAVWSTPIVMFDPRLQDRPQMYLRERNHPIEALSSNCPNHAFDTQRPDRVINVLGEDLVPVMDKIPMSALLLESGCAILSESAVDQPCTSRARRAASPIGASERWSTVIR